MVIASLALRNTVYAACFVAAIGVSQANSSETVSVSPDSLELGTFLLGSDGELTGTLQVENGTGEHLQVELLKTSCDCVRVVEAFSEIDPGETKSISIEVDPENDPYRVTSKRVDITLRGKHVYRRYVRVRWDVAHPVSATPDRVVFEKLQQGETRVQKVALEPKEAGNPPRFKIRDVHASYPFIKPEIIGDRSIRLSTTFPADFEIKRQPQLVIRFESEEGEIPELRLPLLVTREPPDVHMVPKSITLRYPPPADGKVMSVRVWHIKNTKLEIESATVVGPGEEPATDAAVQPVGRENPWTRQIDLTIRRADYGTRETLQVQIQGSESAPLEAKIHHAYR